MQKWQRLENQHNMIHSGNDVLNKGQPHRWKRIYFLPTPAPVQMNATGAEYSRKSINTSPSPMTGIVVIYKSYPAEWAECCVTIPNNRTDARNRQQLFQFEHVEKSNMILITNKTKAGSERGRRRRLLNQGLSWGDNKIPALLLWMTSIRSWIRLLMWSCFFLYVG